MMDVYETDKGKRLVGMLTYLCIGLVIGGAAYVGWAIFEYILPEIAKRVIGGW